MNWDKLRVFHAVAEAGSLTRAGAALSLSQSAISRQVSALEESLHTPLFHRHARGLILTEQGDVLFRTVQEMFGKLAMTEQRIIESKLSPKGPLKITSTVAFGSVWLTSRIKDFLELYPDIDVSLVLADNDLDLAMREADVAIRMTTPTQGDLIQRRLMTMRYHVLAAPEYLKEHGIPKKASDLNNHKLIVYGADARPPVSNLNWLIDAGKEPGQAPRRPALKVNSIYGIFRAVESGIGIGALPDYMHRESEHLVEILPELRGPSTDAYFLYAEELRNSKRIIVFRDFLIRRITEEGLK